MADTQADRYRLDSPTSSVEENCDVEEGKAASPRLPEAKDEEASTESVFSRVAEAEIMGGDHDKRLVFESDSESSDEEEEDDIRGRDEGFEMSNLATVPDLPGEGDNNEDEVNYSGSEQQMDEKDKRDNLSSSTRTVENDNTEEREAKNDEQLTVVPRAESAASSDSASEGAFEQEQVQEGSNRKRLLSDSEEEEEKVEDEEKGAVEGRAAAGPSKKRVRIDADSSDSERDGDSGVVEEEELQAELADLGAENAPAVDEERVGAAIGGGDDDDEESDKSDVEDSGKRSVGVSDFDLMMQRRKEAMGRARRRRKKDFNSTSSRDLVMDMIHQMKQAAEDDRRMNLQGKAATKKLVMLPTVLSHLKRSDLLTLFIEYGICSALADWLQPLPDHSLPHMKIREGILDALGTFPQLDSSILKTSKLGKVVMLCYRHPKESKKNREKAGKLINEWARPIFGLTADFKKLTREEREHRDYSHLTPSARRRLSSGGDSQQRSQDEEFEPQKPGDKGWINRARVPMPSNRDYVVRPKWNIQQEMKKGSSKKALSLYEKHMQKAKERKSRKHNTHAVSISIEGRKMAL